MDQTRTPDPADPGAGEMPREDATIGFVGLGGMGRPMAENLLAAGFSLRVWNRTAERAAPLAERGAELVSRPAGVVASPSSLVITMVADDEALESVVIGADGIVDRLGAGGLHLSMSTVSPALARDLAARHAARDTTYVSAPVFGRPDVAAARRLWICVSGPAPARERIQPVLRTLGQGGFDVGEDPAAACIVKLAGNLLIASAIEALGEACALVEKNGIEPATFVDAMVGTLFACPVYTAYGAAIASGSHEPAGFRLALGLKDARLIAEAGEGSGVPLPLGRLLRERFREAVLKGRGELDWSALALSAAEDAGLPR